MRQYSLLLISIIFSACAHTKKCGNPEGAKVIYVGDSSCQPRIRQVMVGSEMTVPASIKASEFSTFEMDWVDPVLVNGEIRLGYFTLKPKASISFGGKN